MPSHSRRRFLVGAGAAALALPTLEIFSPRTAKAADTPPRFLAYYFPNGRRPEWWVPSGSMGDLVFPSQSSALQPFAGQTLALQNLTNNAALQSPGAAHAMGTGTVMTGTAISTVAGGVVENNISLDQILAEQLAPQTRFRSLQWGAGEPGPCDVGGSSCAYTQSLSWTGPAAPLVATINPRAAFERLFGSSVDGLAGDAAEIRRTTKRSVIDMVEGDAKSLQATLGKTDQASLEAYFDALRDLEKGLDAGEATCDADPSPPVPGLDYPGRIAAFHELIRLAFLCDQTRIITFMIEFGLSVRSHDFINAPGGHHALSHYGDQTGMDRLELVETWQNQQFAGLLGLLRDTPGPRGGTLLDETIVLAIPSMGEGSSHDHARNCPMLFGGTGVLNTNNRKIAFQTPARLTDLHVTLLQAYGIQGSFGKGGAIFGDDGVSTINGVLA